MSKPYSHFGRYSVDYSYNYIAQVDESGLILSILPKDTNTFEMLCWLYVYVKGCINSTTYISRPHGKLKF